MARADLCLETFENDPNPYLRRLERIDYFRYLSGLEKPLVKVYRLAGVGAGPGIRWLALGGRGGDIPTNSTG